MGHAPLAATQGQGDGLRPHGGRRVPVDKLHPTAAIRGPRDKPRPHGLHTASKGRVTPPRRPYGALVRGHGLTAAMETHGTGHNPTAATRS